jgi:predicted DNA-binding transcriptional regulator YafY
VSRRTIYRDLKTLRAAGIDIRFDPTRGGHTSTNPTTETVPDAASLLMLLKQAAATALPASPSERRVAQAAAEVLAERLPASLREQLDDFRRSVVITTPELEPHRYAAVIETFEKAVAIDLCLTINTRLPKGAAPQCHIVQPLRLGYDLETGWRLEGLLVDSHLTCRIGFRAIHAFSVSDRPITRRLVRSKVEWTIADIEVV